MWSHRVWDISANLGMIPGSANYRDPPELECGATVCGHLCQSVDDPGISPLSQTSWYICQAQNYSDILGYPGLFSDI